MDTYDLMFQSNPGNVPYYAHLGSNENSRPQKTIDENRILFSSGLAHRVTNKKKKAKLIETMRVQYDWVSYPSFLESEEFLSREDPEEAERRFGMIF